MEINKIASRLVKPSTPTPSTLRYHNLSFFDAQQSSAYVPLILYYDASPNDSQTHDICNHLENSLSETLKDFYPFAGRYSPPAPFVDCSDQGALFVQAKSNFHLSKFQGLEWELKMDMLSDLLPCDISMTTEDDAPLLSIKITTFECGGFAIAICFSHKLSDMSTICTFIDNWAIRSNKKTGNELKLGNYSPSFTVADRFPQSKVFSGLLNFASLDPDSRTQNSSTIGKPPVRIFWFKGKTIARIRETLMNNDNTRVRLSKVKLVTAILCKAFMGIDKANNKQSNAFTFCQAINLRHKVVPKLQENLFGNFYTVPTSRIEVGQQDNIDVKSLFKIVDDSISKIDSNFVKDCEGDYEILSRQLLEFYDNLTNKDVNFYVFTSWCKFSFNAADFGWGMPVWKSTATKYQFRNSVIMMDDQEGDGVEAWVCLDEKRMSQFQQDPNIQAYTS